MNEFIKKVRTISIRGRFAYGVKVLEAYKDQNFIDNKWIDELLECLWEFTSSKHLNLWEKKINQFENQLKNQKLTSDFSNMISIVIQIGLIELYGSIQNNSERTAILTLDLKTIAEKNLYKVPNIEKFRFSKFSENYGWGKPFNNKKII